MIQLNLMLVDKLKPAKNQNFSKLTGYSDGIIHLALRAKSNSENK